MTESKEAQGNGEQGPKFEESTVSRYKRVTSGVRRRLDSVKSELMNKGGLGFVVGDGLSNLFDKYIEPIGEYCEEMSKSSRRPVRYILPTIDNLLGQMLNEPEGFTGSRTDLYVARIVCEAVNVLSDTVFRDSRAKKEFAGAIDELYTIVEKLLPPDGTGDLIGDAEKEAIQAAACFGRARATLREAVNLRNEAQSGHEITMAESIEKNSVELAREGYERTKRALELATISASCIGADCISEYCLFGLKGFEKQVEAVRDKYQNVGEVVELSLDAEDMKDPLKREQAIKDLKEHYHETSQRIIRAVCDAENNLKYIYEDFGLQFMMARLANYYLRSIHRADKQMSIYTNPSKVFIAAPKDEFLSWIMHKGTDSKEHILLYAARIACEAATYLWKESKAKDPMEQIRIGGRARSLYSRAAQMVWRTAVEFPGSDYEKLFFEAEREAINAAEYLGRSAVEHKESLLRGTDTPAGRSTLEHAQYLSREGDKILEKALMLARRTMGNADPDILGTRLYALKGLEASTYGVVKAFTNNEEPEGNRPLIIIE